MALPTNADVVVVRGFWIDEVTGQGVKAPGTGNNPATITFDPVPLSGAPSTITPNLRDATASAYVKTRQRVAPVDLTTGYFATLLVATDDPDLDAYGGRRVTMLGETPFIIEVPYDAATTTVDAAMAAATGLTQGSSVKAIWLVDAAVIGSVPPQPTSSYLTSAQTLSTIATAIETHDEDPAAHADIRAQLVAAGGSGGGGGGGTQVSVDGVDVAGLDIDSAPVTPADIGAATAAHTHDVTSLTATGTRDATTFLRGDNTWAVPAGGGGGGGDLDADLVAIAALAPADDAIIQRKTGAWTARTPAQVKADLAGNTSNASFGPGALASVTSGYNNTAVGRDTQGMVTTGGDNSAVGWRALAVCTTGGSNMAVGTRALENLSTGLGNVAVGVDALQVANGEANVGIGGSAFRSLTTGNDNVAVGDSAGRDLTAGSRNAFTGTSAGRAITTGNDNIAIGVHAGNGDGTTSTTATVSNTALIGARAQAVASDVAVIGSKVDRMSLCLGNYGDQLGGGRGVFALSNAHTVPTSNPTGGGVLYAEGGALKWRGPSGTVTEIGAA
jgi:hypothetical protein